MSDPDPPAEQALRPPQEHRDHDEERDGVLVGVGDVAAGERLGQADQEAGRDGAVDVAEAAGHTAANAFKVSVAPMSGKMLKSGETSAAAAAASAADSAKVTMATRCTSTPTTAHASRFCDIARMALPVRVHATKRWSAQKFSSTTARTSKRCQTMRKPPSARMR